MPTPWNGVFCPNGHQASAKSQPEVSHASTKRLPAVSQKSASSEAEVKHTDKHLTTDKHQTTNTYKYMLVVINMDGQDQ